MSTTALATSEPNEGRTPAPIMANEWSMILQQAEILSRTEVVPKAYRGKPDDIVAAGLMGRELGFGIVTSLKLIDVIEGNPELNAEGKSSKIRSHGHSIRQVKLDDTECILLGTRVDNGDSLEVKFTYAEAETVQIPNWVWDNSKRKNVRQGTKPLTSKDNWQNYRQDMLWSRCITRLGRRLFGDVLQGFTFDRDELESQEDYEPPQPIKAPRLVRTRPVTEDGEIITEPETNDSTNDPENPTPADDVAEGEVVEGEMVDGRWIEPMPSEPLSGPQRKYIGNLLTKAGITIPDEQHEHVGKILGRQVTTLDRLAKREAMRVIEQLAPKGS